MIASGSPLAAPLRALGLIGIALTLLFIGYAFGSREFVSPESLAVNERVVGQGSIATGLSDDADFQTFWDVWRLVKSVYVDQPVSEKQLYYGAIAGMVGGLNDPYSAYFTPEDTQAFDEQLAGSFFGIGAQLDVKDGQIVVVAPLPGTPAERAGILTGDGILAVDGVATEGVSLDEVVSRIRGEKGTMVTLTIHRDAEDVPRDVDIVRDEITVDSVTYTLRDDGIAVIAVSMFNDDTSELFAAAAQQVLHDGAKGVVLDLRNDPGGLLDAAIDLAGYWIPAGETAVIERNGEEEVVYATSGTALLADIETVVLVNGGSASASEIVAGALQDTGKIRIVGQNTFGKGSVQEYHHLPDGGAVKVTVAKWFTPLGRSIDKQGIAPDQEVLFTQEDADAKRDPQLDAAINILQTE